MSFQEIYQQFAEGMKSTSFLEFIAVFTGIASVWFSRKENILVYPVGLVNTIIYIYLSFKYHLLGEAGVNFYYSVMSIYGWILWSRKNQRHEHLLMITRSSSQQRLQQLLFFAVFYLVIFIVLSYAKQGFATGAIPWADALASATAFTGMWLMAKKKVESWYWWIATNCTSIPLYFVKGLVFTSVYYFILLILAFWGLSEWQKRSRRTHSLAGR